MVGHPQPLPDLATVTLTGTTPSNLRIFGIQTGTQYQVNIFCPNGGPSKTFTRNFQGPVTRIERMVNTRCAPSRSGVVC